jgi:hypothetical protein
MKRSEVEKAKAEAKRLLESIAVMERCAGWQRWVDGENTATHRPHPEDIFNSGMFAASVKRASMDVSRALVALRR